ncbi:MAG: hypothetical protein J7L99_02415 [Planctomycetes bacterium]|nr:hypothetical protein [Planctomycetota bacterium]
MSLIPRTAFLCHFGYQQQIADITNGKCTSALLEEEVPTNLAAAIMIVRT